MVAILTETQLINPSCCGSEDLLVTLKADEPILRALAASAIGCKKDPSTLPALCAALKDSSEPEIFHIITAISSIGYLGNETISSLAEVISDESLSSNTRVIAAKVLSEASTPEAREVLTRLISSLSENLLISVCEALREIPGVHKEEDSLTFVPALRTRAAQINNSECRRTIRGALSHLGFNLDNDHWNAQDRRNTETPSCSVSAQELSGLFPPSSFAIQRSLHSERVGFFGYAQDVLTKAQSLCAGIPSLSNLFATRLERILSDALIMKQPTLLSEEEMEQRIKELSEAKCKALVDTMIPKLLTLSPALANLKQFGLINNLTIEGSIFYVNNIPFYFDPTREYRREGREGIAFGWYSPNKNEAIIKSLKPTPHELLYLLALNGTIPTRWSTAFHEATHTTQHNFLPKPLDVLTTLRYAIHEVLNPWTAIGTGLIGLGSGMQWLQVSGFLFSTALWSKIAGGCALFASVASAISEAWEFRKPTSAPWSAALREVHAWSAHFSLPDFCSSTMQDACGFFDTRSKQAVLTSIFNNFYKFPRDQIGVAEHAYDLIQTLRVFGWEEERIGRAVDESTWAHSLKPLEISVEQVRVQYELTDDITFNAVREAFHVSKEVDYLIGRKRVQLFVQQELLNKNLFTAKI